MSECDREISIMRTPWPIMGCYAVDIIIIIIIIIMLVLLHDITKFRIISYSDLSFECNLAVDRSQDTFQLSSLHHIN